MVEGEAGEQIRLMHPQRDFWIATILDITRDFGHKSTRILVATCMCSTSGAEEGGGSTGARSGGGYTQN